ncbi:hypothetical protein C8R43DRAFT_1027522 [Mycena crocata]|nr:hypothetical protein C8R43DRAFT_1027522 [Mycena crocata]
MDIPLPSNPDFCGPVARMDVPGYIAPKHLVTLKSLLSDRALTVKRPRQQPPSLIFSLPAELLAEVFLQAIADNESTSAMSIPMHFHLVLSRVCGFWRAVALHAPSLWCRIVLHLGRVSCFRGISSLAKICFERSYELPLTLIITSVASASTLRDLCIDLVLAVRHRIRHLELQLPVSLTESLFKLPRNSLKALKSVSIHARISDSEQGSWFRSMSALEGAPLLNSVKLSCGRAPTLDLLQTEMAELDVPFDPYSAGLPWHQLTELCLEDLDVRSDDAIYVLEQTTNLVRCSIDLRIIAPVASILLFANSAAPASSSPPHKPQKLLTLSALLVLEFAVSGWDSAPVDFFDRLIVPSLKELSIKYKDRQTLPCATLLALQKRSSFSLERFVLARRMGDSLVPFLQNNSLLMRLQLLFCDAELTSVATALTYHAGEAAVVLPRLRALTLADRWTEEAPAGLWSRATAAMVAMLRSRLRIENGGALHSRLERFTFGSRTRLSTKKNAQMNDLRTEGMRVRTMSVVPERARLIMSEYRNLNMWQDDE